MRPCNPARWLGGARITGKPPRARANARGRSTCRHSNPHALTQANVYSPQRSSKKNSSVRNEDQVTFSNTALSLRSYQSLLCSHGGSRIWPHKTVNTWGLSAVPTQQKLVIYVNDAVSSIVHYRRIHACNITRLHLDLHLGVIILHPTNQFPARTLVVVATTSNEQATLTGSRSGPDRATRLALPLQL